MAILVIQPIKEKWYCDGSPNYWGLDLQKLKIIVEYRFFSIKLWNVVGKLGLCGIGIMPLDIPLEKYCNITIYCGDCSIRVFQSC